MDEGCGGVVVSYGNAVRWTLLLPSVVEWLPHMGGSGDYLLSHVFAEIPRSLRF